MTIALCVKVYDGIVLASDSASTISSANGVINVYNNGNKIFNLIKGSPIGAMTWGLGNIGQSSIATLAKEFRTRIQVGDIKIGNDDYTIEQVAVEFKKFIYDQHYAPQYKDVPPDRCHYLGLAVCGYPGVKSQHYGSEAWKIEMPNGSCSGPEMTMAADTCSMNWYGQPEAITRVIKGFSPGLPAVLQAASLDAAKIKEILDLSSRELDSGFLTAPMPIQDAIDLAKFLVQYSIDYSKFTPGAPTIGGPVEIAAITKHEGFKWVLRKHYFSAALNS